MSSLDAAQQSGRVESAMQDDVCPAHIGKLVDLRPMYRAHHDQHPSDGVPLFHECRLQRQDRP